MSTQNSQYYKLASIVDNFLIECDLPNGFFPKALLWAIRGLRELNLDTWTDVKTELFDVTDKNTIILPPDFVDFVIVSKPGNTIETLGINNNISASPRTSIINPPTGTSMPGSIAEVGYYLSNFRNGAVFSFGLATSSKGSFRVIDNGVNKELLLDLDKRYTQLYVEYITDGFNPCGETIIHPYLYDYLIKYMEHKYEEKNNPKATESSIFRKSEDLYYAEKRIRARMNPLDPQTLINLARQYTTLALKV